MVIYDVLSSGTDGFGGGTYASASVFRSGFQLGLGQARAAKAQEEEIDEESHLDG
jgi:hypothetical protein